MGTSINGGGKMSAKIKEWVVILVLFVVSVWGVLFGLSMYQRWQGYNALVQELVTFIQSQQQQQAPQAPPAPQQ